MSATRWKNDIVGHMVTELDGEYVAYVDYCALEAELMAMQSKRDALADAVKRTVAERDALKSENTQLDLQVDYWKQRAGLMRLPERIDDEVDNLCRLEKQNQQQAERIAQMYEQLAQARGTLVAVSNVLRETRNFTDHLRGCEKLTAMNCSCGFDIHGALYAHAMAQAKTALKEEA